MDASDLEVRNATYARFVELGGAPTAADVADVIGVEVQALHGSWARLHAEHAIVLGDDGELLMANPFSAVRTPFRVIAEGREWDANCAWDAIGICAAMHCDGVIETTCADCETSLVVDITGAAPSDSTLLFHCLVPASRWWDDIAFT